MITSKFINEEFIIEDKLKEIITTEPIIKDNVDNNIDNNIDNNFDYNLDFSCYNTLFLFFKKFIKIE